MPKREWGPALEKCATEGKCRVCGARPPLAKIDAAHLIPRSRVKAGPGEDPKNIVPLCRNHHERFDLGQLDLLPYLSATEQAMAVLLTGSLVEAFYRLSGNREEPRGQPVKVPPAVERREHESA